ncbi:hypothetical protein XENTR_v10001140 [Xenopus tropicalis]|nr:hypothetical protein XENTR_v10001140 [Xenopus tropicalis]
MLHSYFCSYYRSIYLEPGEFQGGASRKVVLFVTMFLSGSISLKYNLILIHGHQQIGAMRGHFPPPWNFAQCCLVGAQVLRCRWKVRSLSCIFIFIGPAGSEEHSREQELGQTRKFRNLETMFTNGTVTQVFY